MILRFREDKIRRLESLSKGLLSMDSHLEEEKQMLMQELQLMREKVDRNPELTRFAMENIRLLDQLCTLQDFQGGGEREVMMEEISNLRDQLLEVLDGKIAVEQGLVPLTTPQVLNLSAHHIFLSGFQHLSCSKPSQLRCESLFLTSNTRICFSFRKKILLQSLLQQPERKSFFVVR